MRLRLNGCKLRRLIARIGVVLLLCHGLAYCSEAPSTNVPPTASVEPTNGAVKTGSQSSLEPSNLLILLSTATTPLSQEQRALLAKMAGNPSDLNATDKDGRSALIYAARLGDLETVKWLVEAGARVKIRDRFHKTALFYAVEAHRRDIVEYLASNGDLQSLTPQERKEHGKR
jgi:hypothetical protein